MKHQKTLACDFDGVLATYDGWKGFDVFGEPIQSTIEILQKLNEKGWRIIIFTSRLATPTLEKWLRSNAVPYSAINSTAHNPPNCSIKPTADVYLDDRAVNPKDTNYSVSGMLEQIEKVCGVD